MQIFPSQENTLKDETADSSLQIIPISSTSLLVIFGDTIEIAINEKVTALYTLLKQKNISWITELTPAYASLGINYDLYFIKTDFSVEGLVFDWVKSAINGFIKEMAPVSSTKTQLVEIPICFDGLFKNDLGIMANKLDLDVCDIIDIFLSKTYYVFMLGFLPGFTYMGEVDKRIAIPRKTSPTPTKAGAVGIAGNQTGIYPLDSLGGWHILGFTPVNMFNPINNPPNFLTAGNKVTFIQIVESEFVTIQKENTH